MYTNWSKQQKLAAKGKSKTYNIDREARRIAESAVRIAEMTDPMSKEERDEMLAREYEFALERLSNKNKKRG